MQRLEVQRLLPRTQMTLRTPPNWTAVGFFVALSSLHIYIATNAMLNQRWEGFMSWIFGTTFALVALACWRLRTEMTMLTADKTLRLRTGFTRLYLQRLVPFAQIRGVRLTLFHPTKPRSARIELVCDYEVIECPPTTVPREEALCLAVNIGVGLTKVYSETFGPVAERFDQLPPC
jgi:hypothetical protein